MKRTNIKRRFFTTRRTLCLLSTYLASCDDHSFTVYRLIDRCHLPPGQPGWPVCLVTQETIIDETSPPHLEQDDFSSGLTLADWLHLIEKEFGK